MTGVSGGGAAAGARGGAGGGAGAVGSAATATAGAAGVGAAAAKVAGARTEFSMISLTKFIILYALCDFFHQFHQHCSRVIQSLRIHPL